MNSSMILVRRIALILSLGLFMGPVFAAGMSTHALMAEYGRRYLPDTHPLKAVLTAHRPALLAGAMYPDGGYATGAAFSGDRNVADFSPVSEMISGNHIHTPIERRRTWQLRATYAGSALQRR